MSESKAAAVEVGRIVTDVEHVLAEWRKTMDGDDVRSSVVRGMTQEIRGVLYAHFAATSPSAREADR